MFPFSTCDFNDFYQVNITGSREEFGEEKVFLVGFGSHLGTVIAGREWGAPMQEMVVPEAREGSWEEAMFSTGNGNMLVFSDELKKAGGADAMSGHRAIGVVYKPEFGNVWQLCPH